MNEEQLAAHLPKALVADDEQVIADTLAVILRRSGFNAKAVYNTTDAINTAVAERPALVITDVVFKGERRSGVDVAITLRDLLPGCKILLFSGTAASVPLLERARAQGHDFQCLSKPIHPEDLLAKLRAPTLDRNLAAD
jgi:DNA-binding response OmpR family regulator